MDINKLINLSKKPKLYEKSTAEFWNDSYISKKMLEAHLNPNFDVASRSVSTINASVEWLNEKLFKNEQMSILDLGCGPGLYSSRLCEVGYTVTGIDFSKRSIDYARNSAIKNNLEIEYIQKNYLLIDYENQFDVIMLIFCDFGALTNQERDILLKKIYKALKPGGIFFFDVFTEMNRNENNTGRHWEVAKHGFWNVKPYIALTETFIYPNEDTLLDQTIVLTEDEEVHFYRIYLHYYDKNKMVNLLNKFGFRNHRFYSDVTGKPYSKESTTLAVATIKN